jgi:hypothetical protein
MTTLLWKISGSAMSRNYKTHETFKSHSLRGLRNYFVREIGGSFVVIKAVAPRSLVTTTTGAGGLEGNETGRRKMKKRIR